jgi:hypothetical protein
MCKIAGVQYSGTPAGTILPCGTSGALPRTLLCDGGQYSKTDPLYSALFAAIGITFGETNGSGGVGTTHFRVPDTRGIFLRGAGTQTFGSVSYSATIGTKQNDAFQDHSHTVVQFDGGSTTDTAAKSSAFFGTQRNGTTTGANNRTAGETRPANVGVTYCIAY